jgi:hypothetical protein
VTGVFSTMSKHISHTLKGNAIVSKEIKRTVYSHAVNL